MKTFTELILEGHFSKLREEINEKYTADRHQSKTELTEGLSQAFHYLQKLDRKELLDPEGIKVYAHLAELLDRVKKTEMPGKMPMAKARRQATKNDHRKTGT